MYYFWQSSNTKTLCDAVVHTADRICPSLASGANIVADKFRGAFKKFAACHNLYNSNYLTDRDIDELGKLIRA